MAAQAICLDSNQNQVSCNDDDCTYGPCGTATTTNSQTGNSACLDAGENPIACNDPSCTYGDCIDQTSAAATVGKVAAANSLNGGGSTISPSSLGFLGTLAQAASTAYTSTVSPTKVTTAPVSGLPLGASSGTLLLLAAVGIVAFLLLGKKKTV